MIVDDNALAKNHINLYEPVWITLSDRPQPVQLVVNHVEKNEIEGYVSEPKYTKSELLANTEQPAQVPQPQPQLSTAIETPLTNEGHSLLAERTVPRGGGFTGEAPCSRTRGSPVVP
jgi:hypothetical protein